jgi:hypothetical protein
VAQKGALPDKGKKPGKHLYDDEKIENIARYYNMHDNYDSLLRYIKHRRIVDEDSE